MAEWNWELCKLELKLFSPLKRVEYGVRPFSIREYARLQGFPDDFYFENKRSSYKLIGNAVPVHMGNWVGKVAMKYFT